MKDVNSLIVLKGRHVLAEDMSPRILEFNSPRWGFRNYLLF
jgi:hypothetical protein